jgi:spermidine synthase
MKRPIELARATTPDGLPFTLTREADALVVRIKGALLMSSRQHGSERAMAQHGVSPIAQRPRVRILLGGLGLGFTLRATLDVLQSDSIVIVNELMKPLIEWHEGEVGALTEYALRDPRVSVLPADVCDTLRAPGEPFDSILLDVDNGPVAMSQSANAWLYQLNGLRTILSRLTAGGRLVVWSAGQSPSFANLMKRAGFAVEESKVHARGEIKKGSIHWLYVGTPRTPPQ